MSKLMWALLGLSVILIAACGRHHDFCSICQREIHPATRTIAVDASGHKKTFCCPRCALTERDLHGAALSLREVSDFQTGKLIPSQQAVYVCGSDVTPCSHQDSFVDRDKHAFEVCYDRCRPSVLAFSQKEAAVRFADAHGGVVEPYTVLLAGLAQSEGAISH
jgi:ribosomal protein L24E